jgi:hypothetical protein
MISKKCPAFGWALIYLLSGERGEGTLSLSAFIFKVLGSAGWDSAPNFPPHDLAMIVSKCIEVQICIQT